MTLLYGKYQSLRIRIIYFRKVPIGASLANRSAATFFEKILNGLLSVGAYSESSPTSQCS